MKEEGRQQAIVGLPAHPPSEQGDTEGVVLFSLSLSLSVSLSQSVFRQGSRLNPS